MDNKIVGLKYIVKEMIIMIFKPKKWTKYFVVFTLMMLMLFTIIELGLNFNENAWMIGIFGLILPIKSLVFHIIDWAYKKR